MTYDRGSVLASVEVRPAYAHLGDSLVESVIKEAEQVFLTYTRRLTVPEGAAALVQDIAMVRLNMMGAEGSTSASEGDVSRTWDALPATLAKLMSEYRLVYPERP